MIQIPADSLKTAGRLLNRLKFTKAKLPALSCVRLVASGELATLSVTNLDQWLETTLPLAEGLTETHVMLLPADALKRALKADKGTEVTLSLQGRQNKPVLKLIVTTGGITAETCHPTVTPDEFPERPAESRKAKATELPARTIEVLADVSRCASHDVTREILNGVFFTPEDGGMVVATDGRRLAAAPAAVPAQGFVLPNPAVHVLGAPALSQSTCRVTRWEDDNDQWVRFESGEHTLISRCLEGNFPNWKQVVPREMVASVTIPEDQRKPLITWLRSLPGRENSVVLSCRKRQELRLTQTRTDGNQATITVPATPSGQPANVALNPGYLADALTIAPCLWIIDEMSPVVARRPDGALCVVMPMRMGGGESRAAA